MGSVRSITKQEDNHTSHTPPQWESYKPMIYLFAKRIKRHYPSLRFDLEDLVQEGLVVFLQARKSYDPSKACFSTHLWWQLKSCYKSIIRKGIKAHRLPYPNQTDHVYPWPGIELRIDLESLGDSVAAMTRVVLDNVGDLCGNFVPAQVQEVFSVREGVSKKRAKRVFQRTQRAFHTMAGRV